MLTGCRCGEILSLKWDDVDRTTQVLRLRDAKTGPRMVPLTGPVLKVLDGIAREEGVPRVLRGARPGSRLASLSHRWQRIRTETGLGDVRIHDLRQQFASEAVMGGESLPMAGRILGHTQAQTTARYAHLADDPLQRASDRVAASFKMAMDGEEGKRRLRLPGK